VSVPVLTVATVPDYIASQPHLAGLVDVSTLDVVEVGDGNLNLVFIVTDATGRSLTLKQSLPYVRMVGESWPLSQDRILAEDRGYRAAVQFSPGSIPEYFGLDEPARTIAMQDLSAWTVWRRALNDGRVHDGVATELGRYVARIGFGTSAFGLDSAALKIAQDNAANPELCKITEDLIFTHPFTDHPDNAWDAALTPDVLSLREGGLVDEAAELKYIFMTRAEALIHGDLHTGSVFVPDESSEETARVFDIEFAFYGPVAFDVGSLFGNILLAEARAAVLERPAEFRLWLAGLRGEVWTAFETELRALWPNRVDPAFTDQFLDRWLAQTFSDAVGFGGLKAIRRIVGLAKASDIQTLDEAPRLEAAQAVLRTARSWVEGRRGFTGTDDLRLS